MNNKLLISILVGFLFSLAFVSFVNGAECKADLSNMGDSCTISTNLTLNVTSVFNCNNTAGFGCLFINSNYVTLDCNNSMIIGNFTTNSRGISVSAKSNIIIKNCKVANYFRPLHISNVNTSLFFNLTIYNASNSITDIVSSKNINITDSFFYMNSTSCFQSNNNGCFIIDTDTVNISLKNNYISYPSNNSITIGLLTNSTEPNRFINISGNTFLGLGNLSYQQYAIKENRNQYNIFIDRNSFLNYTAFLNQYNLNNVIFSNNYCYNCYSLFYSTQNVSNLVFVQNIINNSRFAFFSTSNNSQEIFYRNISFINNLNVNAKISEIITDFSSLGSSIVFKGVLTYAYNIIISDNYFFNNSGGSSTAPNFVRFYNGLVYNLTIYNNSFLRASEGILFANVYNASYINISGNVFSRQRNDDSYSNSIVFANVTNILPNSANIYIQGNSFNDACSPLLLQRTNNITIIGNSFNLNYSYMMNQYEANDSNCAYEPLSAISIVELWKSYNPLISGSENLAFNQYWSSQNISIFNNNFGNYPLFLRLQGAKFITHDLSDYWYRSFTAPNYLVDRDEFFIDNSFNNLTTIQSLVQGINYNYSTELGIGFLGSVSQVRMTYNIFDTFMNFTNKNASGLFVIELFNQSNSLYYNLNGTGFICYNQCNFSLSPNQTEFVLQNYNITEGVSRPYDPIWITAQTPTVKHLASNLSQSINASVIINVGSCSNTLGFTIKGTTTGYSKTISPGDYTCANNQATLSDVMIEKLGGSTIITINTDFTYEELSPICRNVTQAFGSFGDMFGVIVIAIILVFFFTMIVRQEYITPLILSGAIILTMSGVLLIIGSIIVGVLC